MNQILKLIILGVAFMLSSCAGNKLDYYKESAPKIDIKDYFNGQIKAWGIVQDWRGRVVNQFDIEIYGEWNGDKGTLIEKFSYYDGKKQDRTWNITKMPDGTYSGTAADILDEAKGSVAGNAARWNYSMELPVGDTTYRIRFDDWMWLMNDGILINRSYLKKYGMTVAELTIFMQKEKASKN